MTDRSPVNLVLLLLLAFRAVMKKETKLFFGKMKEILHFQTSLNIFLELHPQQHQQALVKK